MAARYPTDSPGHRRLVELVRSRRDYSRRHMTSRHDKWRENERQYRSFVAAEDKDREGKKDSPWARSIVVPVSFAIVQTSLTFMMASFTQRTPVVPLSGAGPEDERAAKVMEQVLHYEWRVKRMMLELHTYLLNRALYGLGIMWNCWGQDAGYRTTVEQRPPIQVPFLGISVPRGSTKKRERVVSYEGNQAHVVDPFTVYPDPRVPVAKFLDGEFFGRRIRRSYSYMLEQEEPGGPYFNVRKIPAAKGGLRSNNVDSGGDLGGSSDRDRTLDLHSAYESRNDTVDFQEKGYVDLDEMVMKIVPRDYELADSDRPEKWWVTLANDDVIVRADPFEYDHDKYPASVTEAFPDAHSWLNPSMVEQIVPLQKILTFLFNTHIENVRKHLNDSLLVNPKYVELQDLLQEQPGRLIRLTEQGYDVPEVMDRAVKQLQVSDVTQGHLRDINVVMEMMHRVAAAPETLQGGTPQQDRTLGEQQMIASSASNRLKIEAKLAWDQGMVPWTEQRVQNIQQLMTQERYLSVVGDFPRAFQLAPDQPVVQISPDTVRGQFIFDPIEGGVRSTEGYLVSWREVFKTVAEVPALYQEFDPVPIFRFLAQLHGISNIDEFLRKNTGNLLQPPQIQVRPDEEVARLEERGDLIPAGNA